MPTATVESVTVGGTTIRHAPTRAGTAPFAARPVTTAMVVLAAVLLLLAPLYGYHRDELYFRMLPPALGYTDQPPLTPLLADAAIAVLGDAVVALRVVAMLCAVGSLPLLSLITREVGGDRTAQAITAWAMAGTTLTLMFGHVLLTASLDLVVWPAVLLCAIRAVRRGDGRWWVLAGAITGASSFNKLLVVVVMAGIAVGLAACGPRSWFRSGWLWGGVATAGIIALPNAVYQATNGWPQLAMGAALASGNALEVRILMWPMLVLLVGPVVAAFWIAAIVALWRRPAWRNLRFVAVAGLVVVVFVFVGGTQFYYTAGMLAVLVAIGSVPVTAWMRARTRRRPLLFAGLAVNAVLCAVFALPVLPVPALAASGLSAVNAAVGDQVGWPVYVAQVDAVATASDADAIIATNYGEAGALDRFGTTGLPVFSGHNALGPLATPAADVHTVVVVGGMDGFVSPFFGRCQVVDRLDNGVDVDNEEQGRPITVCEGPVAAWPTLWPRFHHLH